MGVQIREKPKGSGVWWIFVNHTGQRRSKKIGTDKAFARKVAKKLDAKLTLGDMGFMGKKKKILFKDYAKQTLLSPHRKASTVRGYRSILKKHVYPKIGNRPLDEITRDDIKDLLFNATARQVQMQSVLSGIFNEAMEDGHIATNPAARLKKFLNNKDAALKNGDSIEEKAHPFDEDEQKAYIGKFWELYPDVAAYLFTLLRTGMRVSEGIGLKPEDIDFDAMTITIRRAIVEGELTTPKNGKSRVVEMTPQLAAVIQEHMSKPSSFAHGVKLFGEWLFTNGNGNPLDAGRLRRRHYEVCEKAGIDKRGMHQLRHSYATTRLSKGHPITDVSKQLGHESIDLTYKTYYSWIPSEGNRQVNEIDDPEWNAPKRTLSAPGTDEQEKRVSEYVH